MSMEYGDDSGYFANQKIEEIKRLYDITQTQSATIARHEAMIGSLERQITQWQAWSRTDKEHLRSNEATIARLEAENAELRRLAEGLANAADDVGVRFFDSDDLSPEVEAMQAATLAVRAALSSPDREVKG